MKERFQKQRNRQMHYRYKIHLRNWSRRGVLKIIVQFGLKFTKQFVIKELLIRSINNLILLNQKLITINLTN